MRGFVATPTQIVDDMVEQLFNRCTPARCSKILDPGCGEGAFIEGVLRWCKIRDVPVPKITGIESHPQRAKAAREKFRAYPSVSILHRDFLSITNERFDYVIGNPPYVSILQLSKREREAFRIEYKAARGRFDLYMLFFEQALRLLKDDGRLVFITPEKYLYVKSCEALRKLIAQNRVVDITLVREDVFKGLVTYPTITTIDKSAAGKATLVKRRDQTIKNVIFPADGSSLLPLIEDSKELSGRATLADICIRVSCGVATGADDIFVVTKSELPSAIAEFAHPTIAGKQLVAGRPVKPTDMMLVPYDRNGNLLGLSRLAAFAGYLNRHKRALLKRSCTNRKPWYSFHDSVPFVDMLRPKILCKDITKDPLFCADHRGDLVPRHSVYYIVPRKPELLDRILAYLRSDEAQQWLRAHCHRAANGFLRVQSSTLRKMPVPADFVDPITESKSPSKPAGQGVGA